MDVLRPALEVGAHGIAIHPAMTFTGTDLDFDRLPGAYMALRACQPRDRSSSRWSRS